MIKVAFVFPGQGSQSVGMGKDFYASSDKARHVYEVFDRIVGNNLSHVCFEGPEEELKRTLYTQPAILATSIAAYELFRERIPQLEAKLLAGHSLGEYGALYAGRAIDLETAARLVQKRAMLMEHAPRGAMAAVLGLGEAEVDAVLKQVAGESDDVLTVANYNTAAQIVISGTPSAVERAAAPLKEAGAKRVLPLPVGGAFHSPLMDGAAREFAGFLEGFEFDEAHPPVMTNVDAGLTGHAEEIRRKLGLQINHSVRWAETMDKMVNEHGVDAVIEFGPGKVLAGMFKKDHPNVQTLNVYDMNSLEETVRAVRENAPVAGA